MSDRVRERGFERAGFQRVNDTSVAMGGLERYAILATVTLGSAKEVVRCVDEGSRFRAREPKISTAFSPAR